MDSQLRSQVVFHLTGRLPERDAAAVPGLRPALLARYRDLEALRHDFPVVFCDGEDCVQPLSTVVDRALRKIAPEGAAGEALRRRVLKVEKEIRRRVASGACGKLTEFWDDAAQGVAAADAAFARDAARAREAFDVDGEVADCDASLPGRLVRHAWSAVQGQKAQAARARIEQLSIRLGEILRADYMRSEQALLQPALKSSFGAAHHGLFDFAAMSRMLQRVGPAGGLSDRRRGRIERALAVLQAQRFFAPAAGADADFHVFAFEEAGAALAAYRERLPELAELVAALQVAELEVDGSYLEELHDPIFAALDGDAVTAHDLQFFPDYLVCLGRPVDGAPARLAEALSSGVPIKVLVQVEDLVEDFAPGRGHPAFGLRSAQLASAALSFDDVFVLQSTASNLVQLRSRLLHGLRHAGPALFSVYAGPADGALPRYLSSAAAMQSRAFPAFTYDPAAGPDLASRFSLENNPQVECDWPVETLAYADQDLQSVAERVAFTFLDFALCDARCGSHFAAVPRAAWGDTMIPAHRWLEHPPEDAASGVPYVLAVDDGDLLCRLVVDDRLVRAAVRCREGWHRLQELGGVHDSRVERLLAKERQAWEEQHRETLQAVPAADVPSASVLKDEGAAAVTAAVVAQETAEVARNPDEPYIETIRCSTCNECTQVNPRMFAYNDNKQAYIADLKAGTFAQLVEAAESCQLSIIHPGKPWNPDEPGLAELVERAKPFQ